METPGLSPWLLFLLCPHSHPWGLIQALEFKYQPPAQDSYVYVFSSGLSLQPPTASPPGHPVHVFSSLGLKLSFSSPLAAASVLAITFVFFSPHGLPSVSQKFIVGSCFTICPESQCSSYLPLATAWVPVHFRLGHSLTL